MWPGVAYRGLSRLVFTSLLVVATALSFAGEAAGERGEAAGERDEAGTGEAGTGEARRGGARWSLDVRAALAWARGWPSLDLRVRWAHGVGGGHALGLVAGISTERLASQLLYLSEYSHTWLGGRAWPVVSLWLGGVTDLAGVLAQSSVVVGLGFGVRVRLGRRSAVRLELAHELLGGRRWADRTSFVVALEYLGGAWPPIEPSTSGPDPT